MKRSLSSKEPLFIKTNCGTLFNQEKETGVWLKIRITWGLFKNAITCAPVHTNQSP
jgi:hypothetical protein